MKVLQINSVCGIGSTGRIATDIHSMLVEEGNESYIAYGRGEARNCDNVIKIGNKFDVYAHVIKTRIFDMHGFGSKRATRKFIEKVIELDPDIIHLHNIHGYYINVKILFDFLKKFNKPVIWTLHDCWPFTGHCANFEYAGCNCWMVDGDHKCIQKTSYPKSLIFNNSVKNYKRKRKAFTGVKNLTIVTPSKWLAELVKQSFLCEYQVKVINNGINLDVFKPRKSDFRQKYKIYDKYVILGVANIWGNRKGYNYFLELSKRLSEDEIIVMVGLNKKQIKNLPPNIIGITRTENIHTLAEIYSTADVFINPTLEDNFPTTNLEALACGTPVITFNTGGSIESIEKDCGYIVEKGNLEQLVDKIKLVKQKGKTKYYFNCIKHARSNYNKLERYREYLRLYKKVVD